MLYSEQALFNAKIFDRAYILLDKQMQEGAKKGDKQDMALAVAVAVNCAFSCELFIKAMLSTAPKKHTLDELFKSLEPAIANRVQTLVIEYMGKNNPGYSNVDFDNDLVKNGNAFYEWRYFHEGRKSLAANLRFLDVLRMCLKTVATTEYIIHKSASVEP